MGEASRRKKLDPNYGKVPSLSTRARKQEHSEQIFYEFIKQFGREFKNLFKSKTVPENYQTIIEEVKLWVDTRLLTYGKSDRAYLAKSVFYTLVAVEEELYLSPLAMSCLFKAVKEYFPDEELQGQLNCLEKDLKKPNLFSVTNPCEKFAYEEIAKEIRLSLGIKS